jgi:hypothetical protein
VDRSVFAVIAVACALSCASGDVAAPEAPRADPILDAPSTYVAKVKNVLVGLPMTDEELRAVEADARALGELVEHWMTLPEYRAKMLRFWQLAFQQTQLAYDDYSDQVYPKQLGPNAATYPRLLANLGESFARTVMALVDEGRPFIEATWTDRYMMTPALMELHAFLDAYHVDEDGALYDRVLAANPMVTIRLDAVPIPIEQTLDPASPNYMHWFDPDIADPNVRSSNPVGCADAPYAFTARALTLHWILYGSIDNRYAPNGARCLSAPGSEKAPQVVDSDFTAWRMVRVRAPAQGEEPTQFWNLPKLRASSELVLATERAGFFSTPAFQANWKTNKSNQMRVTANQALIVATGAAVDVDDTTPLASTPGLDAEHSDPTLGCLSCHRLLDPTRSILTASWTSSYHDQLDAKKQAEKGIFAFRGVVRPVANVADFGKALGTHPLFAKAWVQKLSYWASSAAFDADDPELARIASAFEASGFSWPVLVRELMTSPFTTHAAKTKSTALRDPVVSVARRDHLCAAWSERLGLENACGGFDPTVAAIAKGLPSDGYGRGSLAPLLPNAPTLFYRAGTENACTFIAARVVDAAGTHRWSSADPGPAIADFVHVVMGVPAADKRAATFERILNEHFRAAIDAHATRTDALRSTFVVACSSPPATGIGL